jgi:hypothetical protein
LLGGLDDGRDVVLGPLGEGWEDDLGGHGRQSGSRARSEEVGFESWAKERVVGRSLYSWGVAQQSHGSRCLA